MESKAKHSDTTIKFLCSYGGKILPRHTDGKLRYTGGHTRVLALRPSISFSGSFLVLVVNLFDFTFVFCFGRLYSFEGSCFCRVDDETWRIVRFFGYPAVSIAERWLGDFDFDQKRRRSGQYNWGIRSSFFIVGSSIENQGHSFAAQVSDQEIVSSSVVMFVQRHSVSLRFASLLRRIAAVRGGVST